MATMDVDKAAANFTKAMVDLVGAVAAGGSPVAAAAPPARGPGRPPKAAAGPTLEDCKAVAMQVQEKKGTEAAVAIIKAHGAEKLAGLATAKYPAFIAACQVLLNEEDEDPAGDDDL